MVTNFKIFENMNSYYKKIRDKAGDILDIYSDNPYKQCLQCAIYRIEGYIENDNLSEYDLQFYKDVKLAIEKNFDYRGWYDSYTDFKEPEVDLNTRFTKKIKKYANKIIKEFEYINSHDEKISNIIDRINDDIKKSTDKDFYIEAKILIINYYSEDGWIKF